MKILYNSQMIIFIKNRKGENFMKEVVTYQFDEDDIKLLKKELPDNPCAVKCNGGFIGCCGCLDVHKYEDTVKIYKDKGIFDIALEIKSVKDNQKIIQELQEKIKELEEKSRQIERKYPEIFK